MTRPRPAAKTPVLLTVAQAAQRLGVCRQTVYTAVANRTIGCTRVLGCIRIDEDEVRRLIREGARPAA